MKRALTIMLTVMVAVGMLTAFGAGGVAADEHDDGIYVDLSGGDASVSQSASADNTAYQYGTAEADKKSSASVSQSATINQGSSVSQDATAIGGDGGDISVEIDIDEGGQFVPPGLANN